MNGLEVKSLDDMLRRTYGVRSTHRVNPTGNVAIAAAVLPVLATNPKRLGWVCVNMGDNVLWLAPDDGVAADYGIELVPNGGTVNMIWDRDFCLVSLPWYGLSVAAATAIFVVEVMVF